MFTAMESKTIEIVMKIEIGHVYEICESSPQY